MRSVAVIGGGISGLAAAIELSNAGVGVVLYEKEKCLGGGAAKTATDKDFIDIDPGFLVCSPTTYPTIMELFKCIDVDVDQCEMSFAMSLDQGHGYEWGTRNGVSSLLAQKSNTMNPYFWQMLREIRKFKDDALRYLEEVEQNPDIPRTETLGSFLKARVYSHSFQNSYLEPICASVWRCSLEGLMSFSAYAVLSFFRKHLLVEPFGGPQGLIVRWQAHVIAKIRDHLEKKGCQIRSSCEVQSVTTADDGIVVACGDGSQDTYDGCIMAINAPESLKLLGKEATFDEMRVLGAFQYVYSDIFLHRDKSFMPKRRVAWSTCNFVEVINKKGCFTYWLNVIQNIGEDESPYMVTLNPSREPEDILLKWSTRLLLPTIASSKASVELDQIQGKRGIWFCGPHHHHGFHEDELKGGIVSAHAALKKSPILLSNPKPMVPTLLEAGARLVVARFLNNYISNGCLTLLEDGGTVLTFGATKKNCQLKASLRIHSPQFYWKLATKADLGLAEAYLHGDFSCVDENEGLLTLIMIFFSNRVSETAPSLFSNKRSWWAPLLVTASITSATVYIKHLLRRNTLTQARSNISQHYDLSNEVFALYLDKTMTYSCGIFKSDGEDLEVTQLRKLSLLIEKARVEKHHEVLEIGCGWGSFAIEIVKQTGCKYTGISLSEEQLKYAEAKVQECGLQDRIRFLLSDYRTLPKSYKYDRIVSNEMIEHVGHEYMEEFFACIESLLAEDGILVLQFTSIPDAEYDECRKSSGFIREYIFPGGCLPSLSRVTSAMASSSRLSVEHVENIGRHYFQTLRTWRSELSRKQEDQKISMQSCKILAMGFDEKFIRTWEYYFDGFAAAFKSLTLENYQMVFSRPGNLTVFNDPYKGFPNAYPY